MKIDNVWHGVIFKWVKYLVDLKVASSRMAAHGCTRRCAAERCNGAVSSSRDLGGTGVISGVPQ